ncbi:unnamed protein product [Closterium sp. NIES-53]
MEVARTSMIHAAAPHFLWPFAVRYAAEQLNLWPRVSHPETSPNLQWTGEVGDASVFRVWGSLSLVRDLPAGKLSPRTLWCVFLGFSTDTPPWKFYHPCSHRVLSSRDVTFDESVCFYRLHPHRSSLVPLAPLSLVDDPPPVAPLPPPGPAPSAEGGDQTATNTIAPRRSARLAVPLGFPPRPSSPPLRPVTVDSGAGGGGDTRGADSRGTGSGGAAFGGSAGGSGAGVAGAGGAGAGGAGASGAGARLQETLSPERLRERAVRWGSPGGGAWRARAAGAGGAGPGGASAGVPGVGCARGTSAGGTGATGGTGGAGAVGVAAGSPGSRFGGAGLGGASAGVPRVGRARVPGTGSTGAAGGTEGAGAAGGTRGAGPRGGSAGVPGFRRTGGTRTGGTGAAGGTGGADTGGTRVSGASRQESLSPLQLREWAVRWGTPGGGAGGTGSGGAVATRAGGSWGSTTQPQPSTLRHLLSLPPATTEFPVAGTTLLLFPQTDQSQPQLLPGSPLPAPAPPTEVTGFFSEHREPETRPSTPVRGRLVVRPRAPVVLGTHRMALQLVHTANPTVTLLLATVVTDPSFESANASTLVAELLDFVALCRLDSAASLIFYSSCPPSVEGELALGCDVLEDKQFELECLAAAAPHLVSTLFCPEGDPDALDIPTPRTCAEVITGSYSSQWQIAMDAEMASWKSTGTYVDEVPPPGANIVDGMWTFRVKRLPGSPPAFEARYVAQGFGQCEGVDFFQTFSPTPKMTTLQVLLHIAAQRDYDLHSLDFSTAFL